jgi:DNA-binding CsgD family transcriptional regulator
MTEIASIYGRDCTSANVANGKPVAPHIFDWFSVGIVLLDRAHRVVFANAPARSFVHGKRLRPDSSIFDSFTPGTSQRLGELLQAAQGGAAMAATSIPSATDNSSLMLLVSSLRSGEAAQLGRALQDATAILFVCDPARPIDIPLACMIEAYGLTLAEARVAISASSGMTVAGMALGLGLSPNTVKTHLRRVFAKTGTNRLSELTRFIASVGAVRDPLAASPMARGVLTQP